MFETAREKERDVLSTLDVNPALGLPHAEVIARRQRYGQNILIAEQSEHPWRRLMRSLREPMALLLLGAGIAYLLLGDRRDALVMFFALVPIIAVDYALEERSQRTLARLRSLISPRVAVLRNGERQSIPTLDLVPGDIVFIQEGDILPADGVLIAGSDVRVDESSLTGEAFPVTKEAAITDRPQSRLSAGTTMLSGRGTMVVTATGPSTQYGRIGALVAAAKPRPTPTQRAIDNMVRLMAIIASLFLFAVVGVELLHGMGWVNALSAGISLAIAVIPEEFAVVFTLYLTLGAWRMARRNALLRRLAGVETLGSVNVICADKTGTLTEGRMSLTGLYSGGTVYPTAELSATSEGHALLEAAVLASEPQPYDPLEQSLVAFAQRAGLDIDDLYSRWQLAYEYPFEPNRKYVTHIWRGRDGTLRLCSKGAIEGILELSQMSETERMAAQQGNLTLAKGGMRVLAVAEKLLERYTGERQVDEAGMRFLGLIGFTDPPRAGVSESIAECQGAGIRVIMITGDHPLTAHNIAEAIGLKHSDKHIVTGDELRRSDDAQLERLLPLAGIFARITPPEKHRLVRAFKNAGATVAMTGDGINDAPALREADVGVAMGRRGTEVAREAATMVLLDDNFRTIVAAVREGRRIFDNLQHVFRYLIAFHVPIVIAAFIVPLVGTPLLLLPAHLVWLELILHPTASLVFEADSPAPDLMRRPPRSPRAAFITRQATIRCVVEGLVIAVGILALYFIELDQAVPLREARAIAITSMVVAQVLLTLMERSPSRPFWRAGVLQGNLFLVPILLAALASLAIFLYVPALASVMELAPLAAPQAALAIGVALICTLPVELTKRWLH